MSQAFMREGDDQWLHEISPTLSALVVYLTKENNGIPVYERSNYFDEKTGRTVYEMSNGMSYSLNQDGKWFALD
jgi:hypothetical protein